MTDIRRVGDSGIHTVEGMVAGDAAAKYAREREIEQQKYEMMKNKIKENNSTKLGRIDDKFSSETWEFLLLLPTLPYPSYLPSPHPSLPPDFFSPHIPSQPPFLIWPLSTLTFSTLHSLSFPLTDWTPLTIELILKMNSEIVLLD